MTPEWKEQFDEAYRTTIEFLEGFRGFGYSYKTAQFHFEPCDVPTWDGTSETEGIVTIDPDKHAPRAVAHEMGHGFHECLRRDYKRLWHDNETEGQAMAETIRYFVEERINVRAGKKYEQWMPSGKYAYILDACDYKVEKFSQMLSLHQNVQQYQELMEQLERAMHSPMGIAAERHNAKLRSDAIHQRTGCVIILKFRKGGRITEEHVYHSDAVTVKEVETVEMMLFLIAPSPGPITPDLVGRGFVGIVPWELVDFQDPLKRTDDRFKAKASIPVRVAEVILDKAKNTATIIMESS
jgi:hypothetical protein